MIIRLITAFLLCLVLIFEFNSKKRWAKIWGLIIGIIILILSTCDQIKTDVNNKNQAIDIQKRDSLINKMDSIVKDMRDSLNISKQLLQDANRKIDSLRNEVQDAFEILRKRNEATEEKISPRVLTKKQTDILLEGLSKYKCAINVFTTFDDEPTNYANQFDNIYRKAGWKSEGIIRTNVDDIDGKGLSFSVGFKIDNKKDTLIQECANYMFEVFKKARIDFSWHYNANYGYETIGLGVAKKNTRN